MSNQPFVPHDSELKPEFWEQRYQAGTPRWDLGQPSPALVDWLQRSELLKPGKAIVLGCGRGHDALLFAESGFEVWGIDYAASAIADAKAKAQQRQLSAHFLQRDIFALVPEFDNQFDYVIEHTCFCAIDPSLRSQYVDLVYQLLKPQGRLVAVFFTHNRAGGPPYGTTVAEIQTLFGQRFQICSIEPVKNSVPARHGEEHLAVLQRN
ncbi:MAG: methyltransferase domain-containing protein [Leptolyngbyaceae cyanobacterium SM1_1_3]|nr:methyltransferase domain-containing protein [Leptolyngbyaceae cyanobacterium SM1_1_3]NJN03517.1 methyltransferase domain-containing protein [Leptolyngbyaceae cyanobacterium RM1_1_2]NJO10266.1 methyltransferase domain-containing protein [Leptolyngbyaceae cyanobacterium SL_1_1]